MPRCKGINGRLRVSKSRTYHRCMMRALRARRAAEKFKLGNIHKKSL